MGVEGKSDFEVVFEKFDLCKVLRIGVWVVRFLCNFWNFINKVKGLLSIVEVFRYEMFLVKRV